MPCSTPGHGETWAGQRPNAARTTAHLGTLGLVPATFLPSPLVGPALPGPQTLSVGFHRAQRPLQALTKWGEHSASQPLPMPESAFLTPQRLRSTSWRNALISSNLHRASLPHRLIPDPSHGFLQTHPFLSLAAMWDGRGGPGCAEQGKPTGSLPHPSWWWGAPTPCGPAAQAGEDPASPTLPASNTGTPLTARHPAAWGLVYQDEGHPVSTSRCPQEQRCSSPSVPQGGTTLLCGHPRTLRHSECCGSLAWLGVRSRWRSSVVGSQWGKTDWQQVSEERAKPPACPASYRMGI